MRWTDDNPTAEPPARIAKLVRTSALGAMIALVAGATGFALPQLLDVAAGHAGPGRTTRGSTSPQAPRRAGEPVCVPFGEVVVNLAEDRLTRYLHVNITLLADAPNDLMVQSALDSKKSMLKDWLISYLSDRSVDEVRGAAGVNRVRREIQGQFNSLLFDDGSERIRDVLFEEFTVR